MKSVGSYHAKTHLSRLIEEVARGERFTITRHGVPVAVLSPVPSQDKPDPRQTIAALRHFRKGRKLGGLSLRQMIIKGRRF
jgi:prevent-host-death family protein